MTISISKSNSKIGKIASFSIPALDTCPGKTSWCSKKCYAKRSEVQYPNVRNCYSNNLKDSRLSNFARMATKEIKNLPDSYTLFRIHVAGDFYSVKYIQQWIAVVKANPQMTFYSYTRSWRIPHLVPHLQKLMELPNMTLFASIDIDALNNNEQAPHGFKLAYAGDIKPAGNFITCLVQSGKAKTCDVCKLCTSKKFNSNIYFQTH